MKKDIDQSTDKPKAGPLRCKAWGCNCAVCFDGLCEWHDRADNASSWPKITQIMQSAEFKYLAWYWQELGKWVDRKMIDVHRPDGTIIYVEPHDMVRMFRERLHAFGIDPSLTERPYEERRKGPEALKKYAYRMRELVMQKVMRDTDACNEEEAVSLDEALRKNHFTKMSDLVAPTQELEDVPF